MKKILSVLTICLFLFITSNIITPATPSQLPLNNSIVKVISSNYATKTYTNLIQDENGQQYNIFSNDNLTNQWLTVYTSNNSISGYDILN